MARRADEILLDVPLCWVWPLKSRVSPECCEWLRQQPTKRLLEVTMPAVVCHIPLAPPAPLVVQLSGFGRACSNVLRGSR
eukprot:4409849-Pleurochrysis_carterae.AAC.2